MLGRVKLFIDDMPAEWRAGLVPFLPVLIFLFGVVLTGRLVIGPVYVTMPVFGFELFLLWMFRHLVQSKMPDGVVELFDRWAKIRDNAKTPQQVFLWKLGRTLVAWLALDLVVGAEAGLSDQMYRIIVYGGAIAIGFATVEAFMWTLGVLLLLGWVSALVFLGVDFNSPEARDAFFIGWTAGGIKLSWGWFFAGLLSVPLLAAGAIAGRSMIGHMVYMAGLAREARQFDEMIERRRERLRRKIVEAKEVVDDSDTDRALRLAESEHIAAVGKVRVDRMDGPVRYPKPEDFVSREGGEILVLEEADHLKTLSEFASQVDDIREIERLRGEAVHSVGRLAFDGRLLAMSVELRTVLFMSKEPKIVALREYYEALVRDEASVAARGIPASDAPAVGADAAIDGAVARDAEDDAATRLYLEQFDAFESELLSGSDEEDGDDDEDSEVDIGSTFGGSSSPVGDAADSNGLSTDRLAERRKDAAQALEALGEGNLQSDDDEPGDSPEGDETAPASPEETRNKEMVKTLGTDEALGEKDPEAQRKAEEARAVARLEAKHLAENARKKVSGDVVVVSIGDAENGSQEIGDGSDDPDTDGSEVGSSKGDGVPGNASFEEDADAGKNGGEGSSSGGSEVIPTGEPENDAALTGTPPSGDGSDAEVSANAPEGADGGEKPDEIDVAAMLARLSSGQVVVDVVLAGDRRFCDEAFLVAAGVGQAMAKRLAGRVSGWFEAYEVERDVARGLELDGADVGFLKDLVQEVLDRGWQFDARLVKRLGLDAPVRAGAVADDEMTMDDVEAVADRAEAVVGSSSADCPEKTGTDEVPEGNGAASVESAKVEAIVAVSDVELDEDAAVEVTRTEPVAPKVDRSALAIRILTGTFDDQVFDQGATEFKDLGSFAEALGVPEDAVAKQFMAFSKASQAHAVHVEALAAIHAGDIVKAEALLKRKEEFGEYEHPEVSFEMLETWVRGQRIALGVTKTSGPVNVFEPQVDERRRMFVVKRCGLHRNKSLLNLVDVDLPRAISVVGALLHASSARGGEPDQAMAAVMRSAFDDLRKVCVAILESGAGENNPREYIDLFIRALPQAPALAGWELVEALAESPPRVDLGFDWGVLGFDGAVKPANEQPKPDGLSGGNLSEEHALPGTGIAIEVSGRRSYEEVADLDGIEEVAQLDIVTGPKSFPTADSLLLDARITFKDPFGDRADELVRVEKVQQGLRLRIDVIDVKDRPLGHVLVMYSSSTAPHIAWYEALSSSIIMLSAKDGERKTSKMAMTHLSDRVRQMLHSGVGDLDLCLAVVSMSAYVSDDGETSFKPFVDSMKGRFRLMRSGSLTQVREYVKQIRMLASAGGAENIFGKNTAATVTVDGIDNE